MDVTEEPIFNDLVVYTWLPKQLILNRCNYATSELAFLWYGKKSVLDYYTKNDIWLYELTKYQITMKTRIRDMILRIKRTIENNNIKDPNVLEYGGGIGEFTIQCTKNDLSCVYHDLPGCLYDYALWRFRKNDLEEGKYDVFVLDPLDEKIIWDFVNIMDVLEHLERPEVVVKQLSEKARYIICNPADIPYNVYYPQHISKIDLTPYFEDIGNYFWKNKKAI